LSRIKTSFFAEIRNYISDCSRSAARGMIDCARDPRGYALWQVPLWTAARA